MTECVCILFGWAPQQLDDEADVADDDVDDPHSAAASLGDPTNSMLVELFHEMYPQEDLSNDPLAQLLLQHASSSADGVDES
jgi:hypothetical protein